MKFSKETLDIKGVNGEFYPCKPDIFAKTYDAIEDTSVEERAAPDESALQTSN